VNFNSPPVGPALAAGRCRQIRFHGGAPANRQLKTVTRPTGGRAAKCAPSGGGGPSLAWPPLGASNERERRAGMRTISGRPMAARVVACVPPERYGPGRAASHLSESSRLVCRCVCFSINDNNQRARRPARQASGRAGRPDRAAAARPGRTLAVGSAHTRRRPLSFRPSSAHANKLQ
jgi:hypothetical protein